MGEAGALTLHRRPPLERAHAGAPRCHHIGPRPCQGCHARGAMLSHHARGFLVTPSVLRPKQTTKSCHEHHVYVIMHVIES